MLYGVLIAAQVVHAGITLTPKEASWFVKFTPEGMVIDIIYQYDCKSDWSVSVCEKLGKRHGWGVNNRGRYSMIVARPSADGARPEGVLRVSRRGIGVELEVDASRLVFVEGAGSDAWLITAVSLGSALIDADSMQGSRESDWQVGGPLTIAPDQLKVRRGTVVDRVSPPSVRSFTNRDFRRPISDVLADKWRCAALAAGAPAPSMEDRELIVWASEMGRLCPEQVASTLDDACQQSRPGLGGWLEFAGEAAWYAERCGQEWVEGIRDDVSTYAQGDIELETLEAVVNGYTGLFGESWNETAGGWLRDSARSQVPGLFEGALSGDDPEAALRIFQNFDTHMSDEWLADATHRLVIAAEARVDDLMDEGDYRAASRVLRPVMVQFEGRMEEADEQRVTGMQDRIVEAEQAAYEKRIADPSYREKRYFECVYGHMRRQGCTSKNIHDPQWWAQGCTEIQLEAMDKCEEWSR